MASSLKAAAQPIQHTFGKKQVFLPDFTITFLRTPKLPPSQASFIVPLHFSKLDLRDYLYHVYNVRCRNIRSFVKLQPVQRGRTVTYKGRELPESFWGRRLWRPQSVKKMTVELEKPFVWPEEPENFEDWDKETHDAAHKFQKEMQDRYYAERVPGHTFKPFGASEIQRQAKELLDGKKQWRSSWKAIGGEGEATAAEEVEKEVDTDEPFVPTARR